MNDECRTTGERRVQDPGLQRRAVDRALAHEAAVAAEITALRAHVMELEKFEGVLTEAERSMVAAVSATIEAAAAICDKWYRKVWAEPEATRLQDLLENVEAEIRALSEKEKA